jgi:putative membrane protein
MNTDPRNELATQRTVLANERTFLAYVRTAIMILVSGITLIKLLGKDPVMFITGLVLLPVGLATGLTGFIRFRKLRGRLGTLKTPVRSGNSNT